MVLENVKLDFFEYMQQWYSCVTQTIVVPRGNISRDIDKKLKVAVYITTRLYAMDNGTCIANMKT